MGMNAEFGTSEWSVMLAVSQANTYDVVINQVGITEKRKEVFDFSEPCTVSCRQLIVRKNVKREVRTPADLKGKKLGLGQGTNFGDLAKAVGGIDGKTYPGSPEYLQNLALGRIDAALNDSLLISRVVKQTRLPLKHGAQWENSNARAFRSPRALCSSKLPLTRPWPTSRQTAALQEPR